MTTQTPEPPIYDEHQNVYYCIIRNMDNSVFQKIYGENRKEAIEYANIFYHAIEFIEKTKI